MNDSWSKIISMKRRLNFSFRVVDKKTEVSFMKLRESSGSECDWKKQHRSCSYAEEESYTTSILLLNTINDWTMINSGFSKARSVVLQLTRLSSCSFLWTGWPFGWRSRRASNLLAHARWRIWWCPRQPGWLAFFGLQLRDAIAPSPP